jgi:hypothetical protein
LIVALDFGCTAPTLDARSRIRGLHLVTTDLDWSTGDGPTVEGPAEPLLMAIAGRPTTDELSGPGLPTLTSRIN